MRILFITAIIGVGLWLVFLITPDVTRNRFLAAISFPDIFLAPVKDLLSGPASTIINITRDTKDSIIEKIIPKSPQERRADLITQLEETLEEIRAAQEESPDFSNLDVRLQTKTKELIAQSAELVTQLKQENDKSNESALGGLIKATSGAITNIAGPKPSQVCEVEE